MSALLDTNVLSEVLRARPDPGVLAWIANQAANSLFVSAVTQAEMLLGARLLPAGKRRQQLEHALEAMFREDFAGRILPFDSSAAANYAAVIAARRNARTDLPIRRADRGDRSQPSHGSGHTQHRGL